jgi:hypothetical protein
MAKSSLLYDVAHSHSPPLLSQPTDLKRRQPIPVHPQVPTEAEETCKVTNPFGTIPTHLQDFARRDMHLLMVWNRSEIANVLKSHGQSSLHGTAIELNVMPFFFCCRRYGHDKQAIGLTVAQ